MSKTVWIPSLAILAMLAFNDVGCGGSNNTNPTGHAGSSGTAGSGSAGTGTAGGGTAGTAGTGAAGTGAAGTGTAGTGAAGTGAAGMGTAGTGTAGTAGTGAAGAGAAGSAGTGAAGTGAAGTGADAAAGTSGGHDGGVADAPLPACNVTSDNGPALAAADFCTDYLANCGGVAGVTIPDAYNTQEKCMSAYAAATTAQKNCRSHHLCNSFGADTPTRVTHCPHATGMGGYCQ